MDQPVRVLLVEDHDMVLQGLVAMLSQDARLDVIATATSIDEFRRVLAEPMPDVVVTDYQLPDGTGADVARLSRDASRRIAVLMISGLGRPRALDESIESGCAGFVSKAVGAEELTTAILTVARGATVFPVGALERFTSPDLTRPGATLTGREMEVLQLLASAQSAPEIAEHLVVSLHTARNHIRSVLNKLGARSQLDAVVIAVRSGLITIEPEAPGT